MASELIIVQLGVTSGDVYTIWAPHWRDSGEEWEAFLGKDDTIFAFESVADLVAFVRTNTDHDLIDHPGWAALTTAHAHRFIPSASHHVGMAAVDMVAIEELLVDKPTEESTSALATMLTVVSSLGSVCELPVVTRFFNGNPILGLVAGGPQQFTSRPGRKRWSTIGDVVARNWDSVLAAVEDIITTPSVDEQAVKLAAQELAEPFDEDISIDADSEAGSETDLSQQEPQNAQPQPDESEVAPPLIPAVLGGDEDFWEKVGIDPVRIMMASGTVCTLRCYVDDRPIFLGRNGRVSVFGSERALARYLADEHDHDLADLSTYDDIRTAATDGSLHVEITEGNIYVLTGLVDDIADGPDGIDRDQMDLVVEFLQDLGDYSEDDTVKKLLCADHPLGQMITYVLDADGAEPVQRPEPPYAGAVTGWEELERFVESRLRRE